MAGTSALKTRFALLPGHDGSPQGSLTNFSVPAGFNVCASKVRISVTPRISSVTTSLSPATPVETMRAPLGKVAVVSAATTLPSTRKKR
jgi:hypothetical protein